MRMKKNILNNRHTSEANDFEDFSFYGYSGNDSEFDEEVLVTLSGKKSHRKLLRRLSSACAALVIICLIVLFAKKGLSGKTADSNKTKLQPTPKPYYVEYSYDANGNQTDSYEYDANGNMVCHTELSFSGTLERFTYNDSGLVVKMGKYASDGTLLVLLEYKPAINYRKAFSYIHEGHVYGSYTETFYSNSDPSTPAYTTQHTVDEDGSEAETVHYTEPQSFYSLNGEEFTDIYSIEQDFSAENWNTSEPQCNIYYNSSGNVVRKIKNEYDSDGELVRQTELDASGNILWSQEYGKGINTLYDGAGIILRQEPS